MWELTAPRAAVAYATFTAALFWNLLPHLTTHLPSDLGDPLLNTAILAWNAAHVPLTGAWWNFPGFAPLSGVTSFTEHLLATYPVASPIVWATGNPVLAYNVVFLLAFPANGTAAYVLARALTGSAFAAFVAGLAYAFAPYQAVHVSHLQTLLQFGMPVALLGLHRFVESGAPRALALFGAGWLCAVLANAYTLVFFPLLVIGWCSWFIRPREWRRLVPLVVTAAIVTLSLVPLLLGYQARHAAYGLTRLYGEIRLFSADIAGLAGISPRLILWRSWLPTTFVESSFFPGLAIAALALAGLSDHLRRGDDENRWPRRLLTLSAIAAVLALLRAWTGPSDWRIGLFALPAFRPFRVLTFAVLLLLAAAVATPQFRHAWRSRSVPVFYAAAALLLWLCALGPEPVWLGSRALTYGPYRLLVVLPGLDTVRVPARIWLAAVLCLAVLVGFGVAALLRRFPARQRLIGTSMAALIVAEGWFFAPAVRAPDPMPAGLIPHDALVLDLPIGDIVSNTEAQYRAVLGGYRTINGYSGHDPPHFRFLVKDIAALRQEVLDRYRALADVHVIVRPAEARVVARWIATQAGTEPPSNEGAIQIYRLPRLNGEAARQISLPLPAPGERPFGLP